MMTVYTVQVQVAGTLEKRIIEVKAKSGRQAQEKVYNLGFIPKEWISERPLHKI